MREIKFRAWDGKEMWNNICVHFGKQWDLLNDRPVEGYPIMQFTGLKDKNGKEMYESDICKIHFYHDGSSDVGVMEWLSDASFCINGKTLYSPKFKSGGDFGDYPAVEVIGNIYQNPELLKP